MSELNEAKAKCIAQRRGRNISRELDNFQFSEDISNKNVVNPQYLGIVLPDQHFVHCVPVYWVIQINKIPFLTFRSSKGVLIGLNLVKLTLTAIFFLSSSSFIGG